MAPMTSEVATLRALTYRISSTPTSQLPQHVPAIAASLANCRTLLSSTQASGAKATSSEASVAIHKYRTLLSTLLQDRTLQGRWCAIVLTKATIELGAWETLQKSLPWVRGLLGFLNKPDPPSSKKLCIITLTRIFLLTREYPTLIREITTPSLPAFVQACLQIANSKSVTPSLLETILQSFNELLPRHPTIFRSYLKQLHPLLKHLIAPTPSSKLGQEQGSGPKIGLNSDVTIAARQLYVQLPCCAPKGASSEEWAKHLKNTVNTAHQTADRVFRAVIEDWNSTARDAPIANGHTLDDEVQDVASDAELPSWSGIFAGGERLTSLLRIVKEYLENPTASPVYLSVSMIVDLVSRMLSLTVPASSSKNFQNTVRLNTQASKDERENLWLLLPDVHIAAIEVLLALANRSQSSTLALDAIIVDQLVWVFGAEKETASVRTACYLAIANLLQRSGIALHKSTTDSLVPLIRACCEDVLPLEVAAAPAKQTPGQAKANGNSQPQATSNADTFLNSSKTTSDPTSGFAGLKEASRDLLPVLLANIPAQYLSDSMRARLDRTAILTQHKDAMVASVLNPPPSKKFGKPAASILPLMARGFSAAKDVEGMLRPRMPVIRLGGQDLELDDGNDDMEVEDEQMDEEEPQSPEHVDDHFAGQELDDLLETAGQSDIVVRDFAMGNASISSNPTVAASEANDLATIADTYRAIISEPAPSVDTTKRSIGEEGPLSPSKRVKTVGEEEQRINHPVPPTPAVSVLSKSSSIPATSGFAATSTASVVPELPEPGEDDDSDDDDKISLVIGQDTDDESD